jgi:hypothetical protein
MEEIWSKAVLAYIAALAGTPLNGPAEVAEHLRQPESSKLPVVRFLKRRS